jgi:hypothetical protein
VAPLRRRRKPAPRGARLPRARSKPRRTSARHALVASCNMITATEVCPLSGGKRRRSLSR